ncbi:hypothetical protein WJX75_001158 [Coccomyxa subellipsoidea]|uniref:Acetyl-CoA synthetase-like protein n=1 Tax=Coccomyxa subellipsoidea TaxID=248742 RepID=A0ABR2YPZ0_9CHLO
MEIVKGARAFLVRAAIATGGCTYSYGDLLGGSQRLARVIAEAAESGGSGSPRVAIMAAPGRQYVEGTWGTWLAKGTAVPLCMSHPAGDIQYVLEDAKASVVLTTPDLADRMKPLTTATGAHLHVIGPESDDSLPQGLEESTADWSNKDDALIVYTSGTTGRPKGALHTHGNLSAQISALVTSWEWGENDRILHTLPLHHVHGIINALHCAHAAGAAVEFLPKFSPGEVWETLMREEDPITVFMGVPTMYSYLLTHYASMAPHQQAAARKAAARLRLTVSGSAACPLPVMHRWHELSGQWLLERYGMTETNMMLSNPYRGERRPGSVGLPLPGVEVRAVSEDTEQPTESGMAVPSECPNAVEGPGELRARGHNIFKEYINKPEATAEAFDEDGWFRTGDTAVLEGTPPYWRILGRTSVDIIKSGGYKISALAVENALLTHERIRECAVLGLPDNSLGEAIAAVVACQDRPVTLEELQEWLSDRLPPYQIPRELKVVDSIPRNAMGKINKKELRRTLF